MKSIVFPDVDWIVAQAEIKSGFSDFGLEFKQALTVLVDSIRADVVLNEENVPRLINLILKILISRAYSECGWRNHPECLDNTIRAPLIITGIPRTGTTALHKLLSMDEQFQGLQQWLIGTPIPRPPRENWNKNILYRNALTEQLNFINTVPALRTLHEVGSDEVDECLNLLAQSFVSNYFPTSIGLPHYDAWWKCVSEGLSYRRFANNLRLIGSTAVNQRWLLKNPGHISNLDSLFAVFPDALIIQTHRDPAESLPSLCNLIWPVRCFFQGQNSIASEIGPREIELWACSVERAEAVRKTHPKQFFDVKFDEFNLNPLGVVKKIYQYFGLQLSADAKNRMQEWVATNPRHKYGRHDYTFEQFGLNRLTIHERFYDYIMKYEL